MSGQPPRLSRLGADATGARNCWRNPSGTCLRHPRLAPL